MRDTENQNFLSLSFERIDRAATAKSSEHIQLEKNRKGGKGRMRQGRWFVRERIFECGDMLEIERYPVFRPAGRRGKRCKPTKDIQQKINERNSKRKFARLAHLNFCESDLHLSLTYDNDRLPADDAAAEAELRKFLRRLRRRYDKAGIALKYLYVTERGEKSERVHHHVILSGGVDRDEIEKIWGMGWANADRLRFSDNGISDLCDYLCKCKRGYRRWSGSRNLKQPVAREKNSGMRMRDVKLLREAAEDGVPAVAALLCAEYPGYIVTAAAGYRNEQTRAEYASATLFRERKRRGAGVPV